LAALATRLEGALHGQIAVERVEGSRKAVAD